MRTLLRRVAAWLRRDRLDAEIAEEIRLHLELRTQALVARGLPRADAEREAHRQFGNVSRVRERTREEWGGLWLDTVRQDVRYGLRAIAKAPGFTGVAVLSLAVGIGASTVVFSFANLLLFRPLHAANAEQVIQVFTSDFDGPLYGGSSYADFESFRAAPVFGSLMASTRVEATLSGQPRPDLIQGLLVSGNYFAVLGLRPSRGRFFAPEESQGATDPVIVLSHDAWRRRFGADPSVVGRAIELNGRPFTVIGIGPPRFVGTSIEDVADFFVPAPLHGAIVPGADLLGDRGHRRFRIFGRLRGGASLAEATAALHVVAADLFRAYPAAWRDRSGRGRVISVLPEIDARFAGAEPGSIMAIFSGLIAAVLAILAMACVNVATLLLARATTRRKEIALRLALGASRRRVVAQLLTECGLLAVAGGALGLLLAQATAALFLRFRPDGAPAFDLTLDPRILLFSVGASLVTVVLFGLAPALQATRADVNAELKDAARTVRLRGMRFGARSALVVVQVAVSLALMIGATLLLRSAHAGRTIDPGFRRDDVVSVGIDLTTVPRTGGAHARFYAEAQRAAAAMPGVERAALAALVPMDGSNSQETLLIADASPPSATSPDINVVGAGYFALFDIPVMQGREFSGADRGASPLVAVVNESMAREFWVGTAVGKAFVIQRTGEEVQIVGVVRDLRHRSFGEPPRAMVYFCAAQRQRPRMMLHLRTRVPPAAVGPAVERALHEIDRVAAITRAETMNEYFARVTQPQRLGAGAAMAISAVELALAVIALYGIIAFTASQRQREIALRIALGASRRSVVGLIMHEGLLLTSIGVVVGAAVAVFVGLSLESLLIGVGPADPLSTGGAAVLLLLVGAAASYGPARRVSRLDPGAALRSE